MPPREARAQRRGGETRSVYPRPSERAWSGVGVTGIDQAAQQSPRRTSVGRPHLDKMYIWMYTQRVSKSYSVASARAKLAAIVDEVESGKDIELTRRGKKVAVVMSAAK